MEMPVLEHGWCRNLPACCQGLVFSLYVLPRSHSIRHSVPCPFVGVAYIVFLSSR